MRDILPHAATQVHPSLGGLRLSCRTLANLLRWKQPTSCRSVSAAGDARRQKNCWIFCNRKRSSDANSRNDSKQRAIPLIDWDKIRETHGPMVWSTVARILKHHDDALDCFQDVFAEALTRGRNPVTDWGALLRWLATRRAIDFLRQRTRRFTVGDNIDHTPATTQPVAQQAVFEELVDCIRNELANLPDRQAEAFWLVCVAERTYEEVAQQMGVPRNAVGVLVHRARQHMRLKLKSLDPVQTKQG